MIINARHLVITAPIAPRVTDAFVTSTPDLESRVFGDEDFQSVGFSQSLGSIQPQDGTSRSVIEQYLVPTSWGW